MLGLALSIDFALLFISRYREERENSDIHRGRHQRQFLLQDARLFFQHFVCLSDLVRCCSFKLILFQNIAIGGMIVVSMAVLSSITLLPSVLIALGDRIEKWQLLKVSANGSDRLA